MLIAPTRPVFRQQSIGASPEERIRLEIEAAWNSQEASRLDLEGTWVSDTQFLYGQQYQNWDRHLSKIIGYVPASSRTVRMVWNVCLRVVEDMKSALLQNAPEVNVIPMNGDFQSTQAARHGDDILRWKAVHDKWQVLRKELMTWLCATGNAFLWYDWNQHAGQVIDGSPFGIPMPVPTGKSSVSAISGLQIYLHPHAKALRESPYVMRRYNMSRQAAVREFAGGDPSITEHILKCPGIGSDNVYWETALLDTSASGRYRNISSFGGLNKNEPDDQDQFIQCIEFRRAPDDEYPNGFVATAIGDIEQVYAVVDIGDNPYVWEEEGELVGGHGCVHFGAIRRPGTVWFDSWLKHIRSPQTELNRRQNQQMEHGNRVASGPFIYPTGFATFDHSLSNDPARTHKGDPNARWLPQWVQPPQMPSYVVEAGKAALSILSYIVAPFGSAEQKGTSGFHYAAMLEEKRVKAGPLVDEWVTSWAEYANLELRMWQQHQIIPMSINVPNPARGRGSFKPGGGGWRQEWYSAADIEGDILAVVDPSSALPTSQLATLAFYAEGAKSGMINPMEPAIRQMFYQDMKWGDALGTLDDMRQDMENAEHNIHLCQDLTQPQPLINPQIDDLQVHEQVYRNFQKTSTFQAWDDMAKLRMMQLHGLTQVFLQRQLMAATMMQTALAGGAQMGGNPVLESAGAVGPGAPQGGQQTMTQGFGDAVTPNSAGPHSPQGGM